MTLESPGQLAPESENWNFEQKFQSLAPVAWLSPIELARSGVKAAVSKAFGDYVDRREFLGVLDRDGEALKVVDLTGVKLPFWFDYVADIGDGFSATYAIAERLALSRLRVTAVGGDDGGKGDGTELGVPEVARVKVEKGVKVSAAELPAGQLLVMGGDQVYPAPLRTVEREAYWDRTVGPYELACLEAARTEDAPNLRGTRTVLAIPGNHDWYDGLVSFLGQFCVRRAIGVWQTEQRRSYFAARLPHRWWMWGIDIAFEGPMDTPQLSYFQSIARQVAANESVILCTAKPAWLDESGNKYHLVQYFLKQIDAARAAATPDPLPPLDVPVMLSGDKHFYASHLCRDPTSGAVIRAKVVAGGGGASLSTTQEVPESFPISELGGDTSLTYRQQVVWPTQKQSRGRISGSAFGRIPKTPSFCALLAVSYLGLAYVVRHAVQTDKGYVQLAAMVRNLGPALPRTWLDLAFAAVQDTLFWLVVLAMFFGFFALASRGGVPGVGRRVVIGGLHTALHLIALFSVMTLAVHLGQRYPDEGAIGALAIAAAIVIVTWVAQRREVSVGVPIAISIVWFLALVAFVVVTVFGDDIWHGDDAKHLTAYLYVLVVGSYIVATLAFTLYLFLAQLRSWNTTELAAGLRHSGFKHFLRVHVEADSLTFYTLGIRRVRRRWVEWSTVRERPFPTARGEVGNLQVIDHFVVTRPVPER